MPKYILIAGVNGVGKSTLYYTLSDVDTFEYINTDNIVRDIGKWDNPRDVMIAGKQALKLAAEYFANRQSFVQETTLCGHTIMKHIEKAKNLGYEVEIHYVGVSSVDTAISRVENRVANGGHGIPEEDIRRRFEQSPTNMSLLLNQVDVVYFYDNTEEFKRVAIYEKGILKKINRNIPMWLQKILVWK